MNYFKCVCVCIGVLLVVCNADDKTKVSTKEVKLKAKTNKGKIKTMPDFCQRDTRYDNIKFNGKTACGPTSLSNIVVWLHLNRFRIAGLPFKITQKDQVEIINELASEKFLNCCDVSGTPPRRVIDGLPKYFKSKGYRCTIRQMSVRSSSNSVGRIPCLNWIANGTLKENNCILNVGWYKYDKATNKYIRDGGHWVAIAGFDFTKEKFFFIHDPAKKHGLDKKTLKCHMELLPKGGVIVNKGKERDATGLFQIKGMGNKKGTDFAIIEGAIVFSIKR